MTNDKLQTTVNDYKEKKVKREEKVRIEKKKKRKKRRNYVNFYFLCYSTSMEACSDTNKNNKNIHRYRHIGGKLACLKSSEAIKDK